MYGSSLRCFAPLWKSDRINNVREFLSERQAPIAPLVAGGLSLALFISTMSRDLTWNHYGGDGGELISASMTLGVPHPPGYPLYTLIGHLFGAIPIGQVATRYSFLSALAAATVVGLTVSVFTIRNRQAYSNVSSSLAIGFALALTSLFWGQATVAEVYALFLLFVSFFIWAVLTKRSAFVIGLLFGLATTSHLTGLLLLPLAVWRIDRASLVRFVVGAAIGLSPFLLLPWLSTNNSPVSWGEPNRLAGWWWLVSARLYRPNVLAVPFEQWPTRIARWMEAGILLPVAFWILLAFVAAVRTGPKKFRSSAALLVAALLYLLYAFTYRTQDAAVLMLPGIVLLVVVTGRWLVRHESRLVWVIPAAMLAMAIPSLATTDRQPVRERAASILAEVPANAIVLTPGDESISALWYLHHVEGLRPDIIVVDRNMFQFDWYRSDVRKAYPDIWLPSEDDLVRFVTQNRGMRSVCLLSLTDGSRPNCLSAHLEALVD